jgi:hypothetical protein
MSKNTPQLSPRNCLHIAIANAFILDAVLMDRPDILLRRSIALQKIPVAACRPALTEFLVCSAR